jgi:hypothetical protein
MPLNKIERISRGQQVYEGTGSCVEEEFFGHIDRPAYNELAYKFLNKQEVSDINNTQNPDEKFTKFLRMKDKAQKYFEDTLDIADRNKYIDYENSMKLVEKCQTGNPENPSRSFSRALYNYIKERFHEKYTLKFFTAAGGSHLDVKHKVDCFFKLYQADENGQLQELTSASIDLTMRDNKTDSKADLLFGIKDDERDKYDRSSNNKEFDSKFFDEKISAFGDRVIETLIENYQRNNN